MNVARRSSLASITGFREAGSPSLARRWCHDLTPPGMGVTT